MSTKIGRNDPCPCGSGAKYKHCHGRTASIASGAIDHGSHQGAVERALAWLTQRHRKAFQVAFDDLLLEDLWPDDGPEPGDVDEDAWQMISINLTEWLLAEGDIEVKGQWREINEYLLGREGPALSPAQQRWLEQLGKQPLRLYTVTEVRPGEGLTLVDALDSEAAPLRIQERSGSESARPGMLLGCRVMTVDDHLELSGSVYPFSALAQARVLAEIRSEQEVAQHPEDRAYVLGLAIARAWVRQLVGPPELPAFVDAVSGEPLLLITDHFQVLDHAALSQALSRCTDVSSNSAGRWHAPRRRHRAGGAAQLRKLGRRAHPCAGRQDAAPGDRVARRA